MRRPPSLHHPMIRKALERAPSEKFNLEILNGHNHLLQRAKTGSPVEYVGLKDNISPLALELIVRWIGELR